MKVQRQVISNQVDVGGEGLIGIDALVHQRLMLDFEKRLIKVEDARIPVRSEPGEIVITARRKRGQLILTQVRAAGFALDAVIDTGSEVSIGNSALRRQLLGNRRGRSWIWCAGDRAWSAARSRRRRWWG